MKLSNRFQQSVAKKLRRFNYKFGYIKGYVLAEHLDDAKDKVKSLPFCLDGKVPKACMIWAEEY